MKTVHRLYSLGACIVCFLLTAMAAAQTFTTIDFPGGFVTQPTAINASGIIVGRYLDSTFRSHGFVLAAGKYVPVDIPNAIETELNWINSSGDIVGDYQSTDGRRHAFLLSGGKFTFFDYPGAARTYAFGINPSGDVVGIHYDSDDVPHGYLLTKHGAYSSLNYPGAAGTYPSMVNQQTVVGYFLESLTTGNPHAWLFSGGNYQEVTCPGWTQLVLTGLTPQGDMTGGGQRLTDGTFHGLVVSGGKCTVIDFPGSVSNDYVNSMNPSGDIVGTYGTPDGKSHGYLRTKH